MVLANKSQIIADSLLEKIKSKQLCGKIPSDKKIAQEYNVALLTAVRALKILEKNGYVVRVPRKGTFSAEPEQKTLKILCNNNPSPFFETMQELVQRWDPEYKLVRTTDRNDADLVQWSTFSSMLTYNIDAVPFPREREIHLRRQKHFWGTMFDVHCRNGQLLGVPYMFSPVLLNYNRTIMRKLEKDFSAADLTKEHFVELLHKAAGHGYFGVDFASFAVGFFLASAHVYASAAPGIDALLKAAGYMKEIKKYSGGNFSEGNTLFVMAPRHNYFHDKFSDYDISPMPSIDGKRCNPVASGTLVMSVKASQPERLHELCELTLSQEFQEKVTRGKCGIAMDRQVAMSSMDTSSRRDDFFLSEVKNIHFSHYDYDLDTFQKIALAAADFKNDVISFAAFEQALKEAMELQLEAEILRKRFSLLQRETDDMAVMYRGSSF